MAKTMDWMKTALAGIGAVAAPVIANKYFAQFMANEWMMKDIMGVQLGQVVLAIAGVAIVEYMYEQ